MSKILAKSIKILLATLLLCNSLTVVSQVMQKPKLKFSSACSNSSNRDFQITFQYTTLPFNNDNEFIVELSDENGDFTSAVEVARVVNQNANFGDIPASFQLPPGTFGTGYKIRVRATSPPMIGPESDAFEAYDMVDPGSLVLNNFGDIYICGSGTGELSLNVTTDGVYEWLRDDNLIATTSEPKLTVSEAGKYQARVNYGDCGAVVSTISYVYVVSTANAQIKGANEIEICSDETHTFEAEVNDSAYTYKWYKDGGLVASSNSHTYTTPNTGQFGTYHLEIEINGCTAKSQDVVLKQKTAASFTITKNFDGKVIILPGETKVLRIAIEPASTTVVIQWYKDGQPLAGKNGPEMNATESGEYFARVTETGGTCNFTQDSENFELIGLKSFNITIRTASDYQECVSDKTKLLIVGVNATGVDDNQYELSEKQLNDNLSYQWYKDDVAITGATGKELDIASYLDNAIYDLEARSGSISSKSNKLDVKLTIADPDITSTSTSNSLCSGGSITYTVSEIITGFTYTWLKDNVALTVADPKVLQVAEIGEYKLQISGFGCTKELSPINVVPFDDSAVVVSPSEIVVLLVGQNTIVTASGANSYEWYDDATGNLLSTNETLEVNKIGFYTLVATVDSCEVRKTIEVVEQDDQIIVPNIVSPRTVDGINDTWEISNRYAFQPTVTIHIFDSNGKEVLSTNEYKNDWPSQDLGNQRIFYYKIIRDDKLIKAGSISVID
ncbi:gliding motility-associated C-terminal domain-containing protein [Tenacibaculum sp. TC6]|uniref:Ig-like domain-containing protein n=1 Tax=Tenacibaculum sp. TC6 TaxID=3423223 RepID=UPI003D37016B